MDEAIIGRKADGDCGVIGAVANCLPEWFTTTAREKIPLDARFQDGFVAVCDGRVVGFVLFFVWEAVGHIAWLGIHPDYHRQGIGRRLLGHAEAVLKEGGVRLLEVETLAESVDYEPYERTRAFYLAVGFQPWDKPTCRDTLYMRKAL